MVIVWVSFLNIPITSLLCGSEFYFLILFQLYMVFGKFLSLEICWFCLYIYLLCFISILLFCTYPYFWKCSLLKKKVCVTDFTVFYWIYYPLLHYIWCFFNNVSTNIGLYPCWAEIYSTVLYFSFKIVFGQRYCP